MNLLIAPSREELQAFLLGSLPDEQSAAMIERIERHPSCRIVLDELLSSDDALAERLREAMPVAPYSGESELRQALERVSGMLGRFVPDGIGPASEATTDSGDSAPVSQVGPALRLERLREYELLERLGEGGMGTVYRARHARLDKVVALKTLRAERMMTPESVARFHREMRAVGRLDHPHIVRATDAGEVDGTHFLVMEYVAGRDLARLRRERGPMAVADACELVRQAAVGMQHAHEHGLVHRDLKPSNLILAAGGVKVLDLGLARLQSEPGSESGGLTGEGQVMGTADYMAPEQAADTHGADIRADVYSLGCTLYELLTGNAPFSGPDYPNLATKLMAHAFKSPPPVAALRPAVPAGLSAVLDKAMAKDPDRRLATPGALADALVPFCRGADLAALLAGTTRPADPLAITERDLALDVPTVPEAPTSSSPNSERRPGGRGRRALRVACIAGALTAITACALLIRIETDRGDLVIQSPDPGVQVTIRRDGRPVDALTLHAGGNTVRVRSGTVEVVIAGAKADAYDVRNNKVTLSRGRTEVVTIEPLATSAPPASLSPGAANRLVAEWVIKHGGHVDIENAPGQGIHVATMRELPASVARIDWLTLGSPLVSEAELLAQLRLAQGEMRVLQLPGVPVTDSGMAEMAKMAALGRMKMFELSGAALSEVGLSSLRDFPGLARLALSHCSVNDRGLRQLRGLQGLEELLLDANRFTDAGLADLRELPLVVLCLASNYITDVGIENFKQSKTIRFLFIQDTKVGDRGIESLRGLDRLESLRIGGTRITEEGLAVVPSFRKLKELYVEGLPVTRELLDQFCDLPDLRRLNFTQGIKFGAADLASLKKLRKLESLELCYNESVTDEWLAPLAELGTLKHLRIEATKVTAEAVRILHAALPRCQIFSSHGTFEPAAN